jgi:light-regulated signal transduction histidine kinase (bacteriophytochrome)
LFSFEGQLHSFGNTPDNEASTQLIQWLQSTVPDDVYATYKLSHSYPHAQAYTSIVSGVLALAISKERGDYIVWLRPEVLQTVSWGGNPEEATERKADNLLHPRTSFATWSQTVRDTALPWQPFEVEAVRSLREAVVDRVLRSVLQHRAEELARLNAELERSNNELDAFTYVVSHDLKEPLRGIYNFASILQEDYQTQLGDEGSARLHTLMRLSDRMNDLIESLLHYSRVGQLDLDYTDVDLNELLLRTLDVLNVQLHEKNVQVRVPRPLPTVKGDRVRIGEVFSNLISNAIKYSDSAKNEREIEIGYDDTKQPTVFYVCDNGIGIREKYFSIVFQIFKRLHGRDQYSGGTGAGLTIIKRIVERHGGDIWVQSTYGKGSTFYFTLQKGS